MKASELRIGNYLQHAERGQIIVRTIETDFDDLNGENTVNDFGISEVQPIPLTEEWLLKFGFGKSDMHECGHNLHDVFGFYYDWHFKRCYLEVESERVRVEGVKYVHQLQNLYFALTGEELTIKE